jgi:hypothetical protein
MLKLTLRQFFLYSMAHQNIVALNQECHVALLVN